METISKTSAVPKRFIKQWFSDFKTLSRGHERFKRKPTEGNLNTYRIVRVKARRDIPLTVAEQGVLPPGAKYSQYGSVYA